MPRGRARDDGPSIEAGRSRPHRIPVPEPRVFARAPHRRWSTLLQQGLVLLACAGLCEPGWLAAAVQATAMVGAEDASGSDPAGSESETDGLDPLRLVGLQVREAPVTRPGPCPVSSRRLGHAPATRAVATPGRPARCLPLRC